MTDRSKNITVLIFNEQSNIVSFKRFKWHYGGDDS